MVHQDPTRSPWHISYIGVLNQVSREECENPAANPGTTGYSIPPFPNIEAQLLKQNKKEGLDHRLNTSSKISTVTDYNNWIFFIFLKTSDAF